MSGYHPHDVARGINITAVIWVHDSNMTIPVILGRTEVSNLAMYSYVRSNDTSAEQPVLLASKDNPDVIKNSYGPVLCESGLESDVILYLMNTIGWEGAGQNAEPMATPNADGMANLNHTRVNVVITTHEPICTGVYLDKLNVTRLTNIQQAYDRDAIADGINVTAAIWVHEVNKTITEIMKWDEVSSVVAYQFASQNTTFEQPTLLTQKTKTDSYTCNRIGPEGAIRHMIQIGWTGAGSDADPSPKIPWRVCVIPITFENKY